MCVYAVDCRLEREPRLQLQAPVRLQAQRWNPDIEYAAFMVGREALLNALQHAQAHTITNLPYDAAGNVVDSRSRPRGAGFGVATGYQAPRSLQLQARFSF